MTNFSKEHYHFRVQSPDCGRAEVWQLGAAMDRLVVETNLWKRRLGILADWLLSSARIIPDGGKFVPMRIFGYMAKSRISTLTCLMIANNL